MHEVCLQCGSPLFEFVPGKTSRREVIAFIKSSPAFSSADIGPHGSFPLGRHCPNNCTETEDEWIGGDGAIVDPIDFEAFEAVHTATLSLEAGLANLDGCTVYIDGYIHSARNRDKGSDGRVTFELSPGDHRVVVREKTVHKENRLETNTVHFSVEAYSEKHMKLLRDGDFLKLSEA